MFRQLPLIALCTLLLILPSSLAAACPFCAATSQTFSEEIASMDTVLIGKLTQPPQRKKQGKLSAADALQEVLTAKFEVVQVIKGGEHLRKAKEIETVYFGEAKKGQIFLLMATDPPRLMWSTPLPLSTRAHKYITQIVTLPMEGPDRLAFFQNHLEDKDEMLARDAYDEFAKSPYEVVQQLKPRMNHDQLVAWIEDRDIPASRRRLYLTMLGVCGGDADIPMLEKNLRSEDRKARAGLDALIACYLTLRGPDGMPLVEDLFLKNKDAEYADTYAAIMALRFHGNQADIVPRKRLLVGLRHMLERPQLADLVIPDLAKWEDWSQITRLVRLFKEADEKSSWVKVPVVNYLRACPLPEAERHIAELKKIDPAAVKRANSFFPIKPAAKTTDKKTTDKKTTDKKTTDKKSKAEAPAANDAGEETSAVEPTPIKARVTATDAGSGPKPVETRVRSKAVQVANSGPAIGFWQTPPNRLAMLCVTWFGGGLLCFVFWKLLWGAGLRSP